jgi:hypothetical protein
VYHDYDFEAVLASSLRAQWDLDDVLRVDQDLDFNRNFLPESLARTAKIAGLNADERRTLNQISAHQYLHLFGVVEEFILPFVMDHARPILLEDDFKTRALLNFATEEAKHIHLFNRFKAAFARGFSVECKMVGPREALPRKILAHHPLAVGLVILMIEWMTQEHYLGSIRNDDNIDPLFKSLLKHHWMEECQHAKLDTLIVDALAEGRSEQEFDRIATEYFRICGFLDASLKAQAALNVATLENAIGRKVSDRGALIAQQHRAARWTYIGSGMVHPRFRATLRSISPKLAITVENAVTPPGTMTAQRQVRRRAAPNRSVAAPA